MDYQQAKDYAIKRLTCDLPAKLAYHGIHHTRDHVVPAVERLTKSYAITGEVRELMLTAAWFHDIGFVERYDNNEPIGVQIAKQVLPGYGYTRPQIQTIGSLILATEPNKKPENLMEEILVDADMDSLGRPDFIEIAETLRKEEEHYRNFYYTDAAWYLFEMQFLSKHRYYTRAQRFFRNSGKVGNFLKLYSLLGPSKGDNFYKRWIAGELLG